MTEELNNTKHRRKPIDALALSMIEPGLGQIYCGRFTKGLVFMVLGLVPLLIIQAGLIFGKFFIPVIVISLAIGIIIQIIATVDSWYLAKNTRPDYQLKDYNRWYVYMLLLLISIGGGIGSAFYIRANIANAFRIKSNSMAPSIMDGDRVFTNKLIYRNSDPKAGDIIVFANPDDRHMTYVKRVVAIAGDTVQLKDGYLYINGSLLPTKKVGPSTVKERDKQFTGTEFIETNGTSQYTIFLADEAQGHDGHDGQNFDEIKIPKNHCFVMADNRNRAIDSRCYGPIPLVAVKGRVEITYFPANWGRGKIE